MVLFKITMLLGFCVPGNNVIQKKSKKGKGKTKQTKKKGKKSKSSASKKSRSSKSSKGTSKKKKKAPLEIYIVEVGKPIAFAHIEYELLPKKFKYKFDIVCWGPVAKVFTSDGYKAFKTVAIGNIIYVCVTLEHSLAKLSTEDLIVLKEHKVKFSISTKKKSLSGRAKSEKQKLFYMKKDDIFCDDFVEVFDKDPNEGEYNAQMRKQMDLEHFIQDLVFGYLNYPTQYDITTYFNYNDNFHEHLVQDMLDDIINKKEILVKEYVIRDDKKKKPGSTKGKKGSKKSKKSKNSKSSKSKSTKTTSKTSKSSKSSKKSSGKKSKKGSKKTAGPPHFLIPAEVFFTDPNFAIYGLQNPTNELPVGFLILSCENLMTTAQKFYLNPLIIKIRKLENFPVDFFIKQGYEEVYAYYNLPGICEFTTTSKSIASTIVFNNSHLTFCRDVPKLKLLEFIQTRRVYVEIRGVKTAEFQKPPGHIFTKEKEDKHVSKRFLEKDCIARQKDFRNSPVSTLMVACFDIGCLLKDRLLCESTEQCHSLQNSLYSEFYRKKPLKLVDVITINEIHMFGTFDIQDNGEIPEFELTTRTTSLKISVELLVPQFANIYMHRPENTYKRIFTVIFDRPFAAVTLNDVLLYNQETVGIKTVLAGVIKKLEDGIEDEESLYSKAITGFVIDNGNDFLLYLEGPSDGYIMSIWHQLQNLSLQTGSVFLNTDHVFEKRLYEEFLGYQPVYFVAMKIHLQTILRNHLTFITGQLPQPCLQALMKLNLILNSSSIKDMLQHNLFPTAQELISLGLEFGVPLRWESNIPKIF